MAHTDPDMTRTYQKGHARKVLRIDMMLPFSVNDDRRGVREKPADYRASLGKLRPGVFPENSRTKKRQTTYLIEKYKNLERETGLEPATSTLARLRSTN